LGVMGKAFGCELRLNVDGVSPLHCGIVNSYAGLFLRDLSGGGKTLLNGSPAANGPLKNGDILGIGPFQFQIRMGARSLARSGADVQVRYTKEKDALRIQAAAVAAQQAALAEEETKLDQRRAALEQQEEQLSAHLEEKRRRLLEIRDQARNAHAVLKNEREEY